MVHKRFYFKMDESIIVVIVHLKYTFAINHYLLSLIIMKCSFSISFLIVVVVVVVVS
jgi:hypothetical protein